jgi:hypothetical protein
VTERLSSATQAVADTYAAILRRRTGRTWIVVAGSAPVDRDTLGDRNLGAGMRGAADPDDLDRAA